MKAVCVDDHRIILSSMISYVKELLPEAEVVGFDDTDRAFSFIEENGCDILFTEIELRGGPAGLSLARGAQKINPRVNIIFTTVCSQQEYAEEVMQLRPSDYLTKVVTKEDVQGALQNLLYAVG